MLKGSLCPWPRSPWRACSCRATAFRSREDQCWRDGNPGGQPTRCSARTHRGFRRPRLKTNSQKVATRSLKCHPTSTLRHSLSSGPRSQTDRAGQSAKSCFAAVGAMKVSSVKNFRQTHPDLTFVTPRSGARKPYVDPAQLLPLQAWTAPTFAVLPPNLPTTPRGNKIPRWRTTPSSTRRSRACAGVLRCRWSGLEPAMGPPLGTRILARSRRALTMSTRSYWGSAAPTVQLPSSTNTSRRVARRICSAVSIMSTIPSFRPRQKKNAKRTR